MVNRILIFILLAIHVTSVKGQLKYLRLSPVQKIEQKIGATDVKVEFSRPQMKGRKIFGDIVPYDKMWRTGANENTKITFGYRVRIGSVDVEPGTYTLLTKPQVNNWEIYFYTDTNNLDVPNPLDSSKLIYLLKCKTERLNESEKTLTINFHNITETSANLRVSWENIMINIPIQFNTHEAMESIIAKEFKSNALEYSIAASYYNERNLDLDKAKKLQELSIELRDQPSAWAYNSYGIILQKLGEKVKAINAFEYSLKLAKELGNEYLISENEKILKKLSYK